MLLVLAFVFVLVGVFALNSDPLFPDRYALTANTALSDAANKKCNPVKPECGCGQLKDAQGNCAKGDNMWKCPCPVDPSGGFVQAECTAPNKCTGTKNIKDKDAPDAKSPQLNAEDLRDMKEGMEMTKAAQEGLKEDIRQMQEQYYNDPGNAELGKSLEAANERLGDLNAQQQTQESAYKQIQDLIGDDANGGGFVAPDEAIQQAQGDYARQQLEDQIQTLSDKVTGNPNASTADLQELQRLTGLRNDTFGSPHTFTDDPSASEREFTFPNAVAVKASFGTPAVQNYLPASMLSKLENVGLGDSVTFTAGELDNVSWDAMSREGRQALLHVLEPGGYTPPPPNPDAPGIGPRDLFAGYGGSVNADSGGLTGWLGDKFSGAWQTVQGWLGGGSAVDVAGGGGGSGWGGDTSTADAGSGGGTPFGIMGSGDAAGGVPPDFSAISFNGGSDGPDSEFGSLSAGTGGGTPTASDGPDGELGSLSGGTGGTVPDSSSDGPDGELGSLIKGTGGDPAPTNASDGPDGELGSLIKGTGGEPAPDDPGKPPPEDGKPPPTTEKPPPTGGKPPPGGAEKPPPGGGGGGGGMPMPPMPGGGDKGGGGQPQPQQTCSFITSLFGCKESGACDIRAASPSIQQGMGATLSWNAPAGSVYASISGIGPVNPSGSTNVYPQTTTTYTMNVTVTGAESAGRSATCQTTVSVTPRQTTPQNPHGTGTDGKACMPPPQPSPSGCTVGSWKPVSSSGNGCTTGWQCVPSGATPSAQTPTAQLICQPQVADVGMPVKITYSCGNATGSSGAGFSTNNALSGSATTTGGALSGNTNTATFALTCINQEKTVGAECRVQIAKPSIILVANPKIVASGKQSGIGWVTSGMKVCALSSPQLPFFTAEHASNANVNGTATTPPLSKVADFVLTCTTLGGGTRAATTTVSVH